MATRNVLEIAAEHCDDKVANAIGDLVEALDCMDCVRQALTGDVSGRGRHVPLRMLEQTTLGI